MADCLCWQLLSFYQPYFHSVGWCWHFAIGYLCLSNCENNITSHCCFLLKFQGHQVGNVTCLTNQRHPATEKQLTIPAIVFSHCGPEISVIIFGEDEPSMLRCSICIFAPQAILERGYTFAIDGQAWQSAEEMVAVCEACLGRLPDWDEKPRRRAN